MGFIFCGLHDLRRSLAHLRNPLGWIAFLAGLVFFTTTALTQEPSSSSASPTPSELFSRVISNQKKSEILLDEYERMQRIERRKTGSDTNPLDTKDVRLFPTGIGVDKIAVSTDGKAVDSESYRDDLEKLEKYLAWIAEDGAPQREATAKAERRRKERFELIEATHQAFHFTFEGKEMRGDRTLLCYSMTPDPAYRPTSRNTVLFTKVRGTIWVDEQSSELAKVEGSVTDDVSIALFLAKVYKGSHFMQERYEIAPGIWEPTFEQYDFDGRKFMVPFSIHERTFYSNYKHVGRPKDAIEALRAELSKLAAEQPSR